MCLQHRREGDRGFTLIELLVVIIVIGVLAAIAIPLLIRQREKAWDVALATDLRNAAIAQDAFLTDGTFAGAWATDVAQLEALGFRPSSNRSYFGGTFAMDITLTGEHYCMVARSQSGNYVGYGSGTGPVLKGTPVNAATCT